MPPKKLSSKKSNLTSTTDSVDLTTPDPKKLKLEVETPKTKEEKASAKAKRAKEKEEAKERSDEHKRRKLAKDEFTTFNLTPTRGNPISPIRTKYEGNREGRHIIPYKFLTRFVKSLIFGNEAEKKFTNENLDSDAKLRLEKIFGEESAKKFDKLIAEQPENNETRKLGINFIKISSEILQKRIDDLKSEIEKTNKKIKLLETEIDSPEKLASITKNKEKLEKKEKELTQNIDALKKSFVPLAKLETEEKREKDIKILNAANELLQTIEGLTYKSKIHSDSKDYLAEALQVQVSMRQLERLNKEYSASKTPTITPEIEEQIFENLIKTLDIPKKEFVQTKTSKDKTPKEGFKEADFFRFLGLHLFLAKESFHIVNQYFQSKETPYNSDKYNNFTQNLIYQSLFKKGWIEILENNGQTLTPAQEEYKTKQKAIYDEFSAKTGGKDKKKAEDKEMQDMLKKIDALEVPPSTAAQLDFLLAEFHKYVENDKGAFKLRPDSRFSSKATVAKDLAGEFDLGGEVKEAKEEAPKTPTKEPMKAKAEALKIETVSIHYTK